MITLHLEKIYRYPRIEEHLSVTIPFAKGQLRDTEKVRVYDGEESLPVQCKVTGRYSDGSVKYLFVRFVGDLPGNAGKEFQLDYEEEKQSLKSGAVSEECREQTSANVEVANCMCRNLMAVAIEELQDGYSVQNGSLQFQVRHNSKGLFEALNDGNRLYQKENFAGPYLELREGNSSLQVADMHYGIWEVTEQGPLCTILKNKGVYGAKSAKDVEEADAEIAFETKLTVWSGKPWVEVSYRLINTTDEELDIASLGFYCKAEADSPLTGRCNGENNGVGFESNVSMAGADREQNSYHTKGTAELPALEALCPVEGVRTCTGYSNYKTDFTIGSNGKALTETVNSQRVLMEMNEHFQEVLYGTFFADRTDARGGICATIYQAQQNFPKAVSADKNGLAVMLVPQGDDRVVMQPGMSREQRFLLHFHASEETLTELDNRSLIYQMPDRPVINPEVFAKAGVMPDVFPEKPNVDAEIMLMRKADGHNRVFGMLNWGDTYDANYSAQGRGGGRPVWTNNEYDYPHACALMYARTGTRRFLDYLLVSASHWMDVDICHHSNDPMRLGGQVEHTRGHVVGGKVIISHEWVEGLLDFYHFTGDERGLEAAIGIGENVLRQLDTPQYTEGGEISARETGWALRTLAALYVETGQERWLEKCEWIVGHFREWEKNYGYWLSPYTDNTLIRVGFMISVAVGSLMRYYRVKPSEELRAMMIRAIDDLVENCRLENGLFYYKELPSLTRLGGNTLLLEAMAIGYELTGDEKYLEAGLPTYRQALHEGGGKGGQRVHVEDAVIWPGDSCKNFGQSFLPLACFDRALEQAGLR